MDITQARRVKNPNGSTEVVSRTVHSDHVIEAFRHQHDQRNQSLVIAGESLIRSNIDVSWLEAASDSYDISADPRDYVLVDIPIVTVDIPNRNMQAFPYEEVSYFDPLYGKMVYQTFDRKPCLSGDALVATSSGMIPIDQLSGFDGNVLTRTGSAKVKNWQKTGYEKTLTITTKSGAQLRATGNHPFLVLTRNLDMRWRNADNLQVGDVLVLRKGSLCEDSMDLSSAAQAVERLYAETFEHRSGRSHDHPVNIRKYPEYRRSKKFPKTLTKGLARILGYLVSDGGVSSENGRVDFFNSDRDLLNDFQDCWEASFGERLACHNRGKPTHLVGGYAAKKTGYHISSSKNDVRVWLEALGLGCHTAPHKSVPDVILRSSKSYIVEFLRAFIEGDGFLSKGSSSVVTLHSSSATLLSQLKLLIEAVGFHANVNPEKGYVRLRKGESIQFMQLVDCVSERHQSICDGLDEEEYQKESEGGIPFVRDFVSHVVKKHAYGRGRSRRYYDSDGNTVKCSIVTQYQDDDSTPDLCQAKRPGPKHVEAVAKTLSKLDPEYERKLMNLIGGDFYFDDVSRVERNMVTEPVYDIETTSSQFVANGVVVHNCHQDHENKDPLKAKGVIFDASIQAVSQYDVHKIRILAGWDRNKDPWLVDQILSKKRTGYSMGALVENFVCSVCGSIDTNIRKCPCMMKGKGYVMPTGQLVYQQCVGVNFIENSSVDDPADITADTESIWA